MAKKNVMRNLATAVKEEPLLGLVMGMAPGAIEAGEAQGQREFVQSDVLPNMKPEERTALEAAGVVFGEPVKSDDLFVYVTLPTGWRKQVTEHSMWSELLDERGRVRAAIFYKSSFYDRKARITLKRFHEIEDIYPADDSPEDIGRQTRSVARAYEGGLLFDSGWITSEQGRSWKIVEEWLDENRPGWKDPAKFW